MTLLDLAQWGCTGLCVVLFMLMTATKTDIRQSNGYAFWLVIVGAGTWWLWRA